MIKHNPSFVQTDAPTPAPSVLGGTASLVNTEPAQHLRQELACKVSLLREQGESTELCFQKGLLKSNARLNSTLTFSWFSCGRGLQPPALRISSTPASSDPAGWADLRLPANSPRTFHHFLLAAQIRSFPCTAAFMWAPGSQAAGRLLPAVASTGSPLQKASKQKSVSMASQERKV